jgi:hypothetical protein
MWNLAYPESKVAATVGLMEGLVNPHPKYGALTGWPLVASKSHPRCRDLIHPVPPVSDVEL